MNGSTFAERVALLAMLMSLVALSIDAILPALQLIGDDLGAPTPNDAQFVITSLLLGLSAGQLFYGPLSDSFGRKPMIQLGLVVFLAGSTISMLATSFEMMLVGRFLQGAGAAGPRVVTIALVRDQFAGRQMARMMSFIMTVFILVPALAPALGQAILLVADWRMIYGSFLTLAAIAFVWLTFRQPETHPTEARLPLSLRRIGGAMVECLTNRISLCYMITSGLVFGSFVGFLTSVQQIFGTVYGVGEMFALYFALLALGIGFATIVNARIVVRFGMRWLTRIALVAMLVIATTGLAVAHANDGRPDFMVFMALLAPMFFCFGSLFGNFNALAMEPMGHIAGSASAVLASLTSLIAAFIGTTIGQQFDGTVVPLFAGFALAALSAIVLIVTIDQGVGSEESDAQA